MSLIFLREKAIYFHWLMPVDTINISAGLKTVDDRVETIVFKETPCHWKIGC